MRRTSATAIALLAGFAVWSAACPLGAQPPPALQGLSLEAAIAEIESSGLIVYYSSSLIKRGMRVRDEPPAGAPEDQLRVILAPFDLTTEVGPSGSLLIVRSPARRVAANRLVGQTRAPLAPLEPPPIDELIVAASRYELVRDVAASTVRLAGSDIAVAPDLGDDALRGVQRLPGTTSNGFSARTNIRGGEVGETLVLFDRLRLYDPYHLEEFQSVFSTVDPQVVRSIDVYTGGFPAAFGDRMSGVIDVATVVDPKEGYSEVGLSFFNTSLLNVGQFHDGDGQWVASVRRSNLDLLYNAFSLRPERPRYVDAFGKLSYRPSDALAITFNTLYFRDDVALNDDVDIEEQAAAENEDRYVWARFDHTLGDAWQGATLVAHTALTGDRRGTSAKEGITSGSLADHRQFAIDSVQSDWSWSANDQWLVQVGGAFSRANGTYDYRDDVAFDLRFDAPDLPDYAQRTRALRVASRGDYYGLYTTVRYSPTARIAADLGVRWDRQTLAPSNPDTAGPRIGVRYQIAARTYLKASWGRFWQSQSINELQIADGVTRFFRPQQSEQVVIGFEHELPRGIALRFEAYDKDMRDLRPRFENLLNTLTLLPELQPDRVLIAPDAARARGAEWSLSQQWAPAWTWWVTLGRARVEDLFGPVEVARSWDQATTAGAGLHWESANWDVAVAFGYRSGWPTTAIALDTSSVEPLLRAGARNAERFPAYQSVDFRITRHVEFARTSLAVFAELNNVFDRRNRCCTEYQLELDTGEPVLDLSPRHYLARVPSFGFVWRF